MNFIEIVIYVLIIAFFVVVYYDLKDSFRKGGDFTMKNQPKPPKKEPRFSDKESDFYYSFNDLTPHLKGNSNHFYDEITRLNNRVEGLSKENIQLRNSKLMLRRQTRIYKNEISRLKKELESVI